MNWEFPSPPYSKLERGATELTLSRLQKIAFILGFSTAELMNNNMEVLAARLLQR
ncbi:MAG: helix-turn-helix transcriptional regulator [Saprospirales bacterium]|nr:helix-turn-helix transcriptional regulator [Saprospirales bacterium]MBK8923763.1 helix-turn-helix transcriptional regulator [Saprospirales bacterium]